jgi:hypothetical protein
MGKAKRELKPLQKVSLFSDFAHAIIPIINFSDKRGEMHRNNSYC